MLLVILLILWCFEGRVREFEQDQGAKGNFQQDDVLYQQQYYGGGNQEFGGTQSVFEMPFTTSHLT